MFFKVQRDKAQRNRVSCNIRRLQNFFAVLLELSGIKISFATICIKNLVSSRFCFNLLLCTLFLLCTLYFGPFSTTANASVSKTGDYKDFRSTQIGSYSAATIDAETGELLFGKRENTEKPVASITKLLGAEVFLSTDTNLNKKVRMESNDEVGGGRLRLPIGTTMRAKNFLYASLIGSANNSATALVRLSGLGKNNFIDKMNDLAHEAGATEAKFVDACGISPDNKGSAKGLALIGKKVFDNKSIRSISSRKRVSFNINNGKGTKTIVHTSPIISQKNISFKVLAAKTGFLPEVGDNLIVKLQSKKDKKAKVIVVLMGAVSKNAAARDAAKLGKWAFKNYKW